MENDDKYQKQLYLRNQILQKGYDPQNFVAFLSINSDSIDLDQWDLEELKGIVAKYKIVKDMQNSQKKQKNQKKQQISQINGMVVHTNYLQMVKEKNNKIQYERYQPLFDYEFQGSCKCIENSKLVTDKVIVKIPQFNIKENQGFFFGLGSSIQIWYEMENSLIPAKIKRLSEDFEWLSSTLIRLYPYLALPQLQPFRRDIPQPNQIRRKQIQQYMQHLCMNQSLLQTQIFFQFLTITHQKIPKYRKNYDSISFVKGVSLLKTQTGTIQIQLSNKLRQFVKTSNNHNRQISHIHQTISTNIVKLLTDYRVVQEDLYAIVDNYAELHDAYSQLTNKFPTQKKNSYCQMLINLNNLFLGLGDSVKHNITTIRQQVKDYYRLSGTYDKSISRLYKLTKQAQKQYLQYKYQLNRKKQRLFNDSQKWQLIQNKKQYVKNLLKQMNQCNNNNSTQSLFLKNQIFQNILPKQSSIQKQMKLWMGFMLLNYYKQYQKCIQIAAQRYAQKFKIFATRLLSDDKGYLETITKFISSAIRS